nr:MULTISPECIES: plasmid pRiA4b ORF-3 family protein [Burkholderia]
MLVPDRRRSPCLGGRNACPPEDVDGVRGYADFF